ncbi:MULTISPECIES: coiled-coil domain-containing protein [unclassified Nocardiopsis]|uniref:coiled-coil domain-containing protein n=1 Tax=Nocardiopsis TaxID=2013 RepID=UPI00387AC19F
MTPTPRSRRGRRAALSLAAAVAALAVALPGTALAEPDDDEVDIEELERRADELEETYQGELLQFTEIKERVEKAEKDLKEIEERLEGSREGVSAIVATQYKTSSNGFDPAFSVIFSSEPEDLYGDAATLTYLGESQAEQISGLIDTRDEAQEVRDELEGELKDAEDLIDELEEKKDEVAAKIEEYEESQVPDPPAGGGGGGTGGIPDSAVGSGWAQTTPRMAAIRDEIIRNVGVPQPVSCWRSSADDHGEGRACDFMVSYGTHPSADNKAWGQRIADYAINNADRLGVEYVIWEQQIWHSANRSWRFMNDRGSVTQNHYDHVHITSY